MTSEVEEYLEEHCFPYFTHAEVRRTGMRSAPRSELNLGQSGNKTQEM